MAPGTLSVRTNRGLRNTGSAQLFPLGERLRPRRSNWTQPPATQADFSPSEPRGWLAALPLLIPAFQGHPGSSHHDLHGEDEAEKRLGRMTWLVDSWQDSWTHMSWDDTLVQSWRSLFIWSRASKKFQGLYSMGWSLPWRLVGQGAACRQLPRLQTLHRKGLGIKGQKWYRQCPPMKQEDTVSYKISAY